MNPVTRALLNTLGDTRLDEFAADWDHLELLVVDIYKQKSVSFEQQEEYFRLRERLEKGYVLLSEELRLFWPSTKIRGVPLGEDPFAALISTPTAKEFVGNWDAMRTLPAAREALNQMLMGRIESKAD